MLCKHIMPCKLSIGGFLGLFATWNNGMRQMAKHKWGAAWNAPQADAPAASGPQDVKNGRFRDIGVLRGPGGHIEDRVTVRVAMEREVWDRLAQAADMRGTSAAEIIRVLVAEWLDEVKE